MNHVIIRLMKSPVILLSQIRTLSLIGLGILTLTACQATSEPQLGHWSTPQFAGIPDAVKLNELSGIARSNSHPGIYWTLNDGGNPSELIAIDSDAKTKAIIAIDGISNIDWEDIATYQLAGEKFIVIADTGDNGGLRTDLFLHIIKEPIDITANSSVKDVRTIKFQWSDGARDSEAMVVDEKREQFLLISKKRVPAEVYTLPIDAKDNLKPKFIATLEGIAQPDQKIMNEKKNLARYRSQITGADISPDGSWLAVLNYQQVIFYFLPDGKIPRKLIPVHTITLPWLPQAEGIAFSLDGNSLFIGSEQSPVPMIRLNRVNP